MAIVAPRRSDSVTVKPSSGSTVVSPATLTVMVWLVWPGGEADRARGQHAAGEVGRIGRTAAAAGRPPRDAARARRSPERVTVKVNGVVPLLPSAWLALAAAIESARPVSSLRMVPVAAAVAIVVPAGGTGQRDGEALVGSTVVSPATLTVMVWLVWPAAKLTVPEGSTPPVKSAALAGLPPTAGRPSRWRCSSPSWSARTGDGEGERRAAAIALRLAGVARRDRD